MSRRAADAGALLRTRKVQAALVVVLVAAFAAASLLVFGRSTERAGAAGVQPGTLAPAPRGKLAKLLKGAELVPSLSTPTSRTYKRPDGSFVSRIFARPPSYRDAKGVEHLVDTTVKPAANATAAAAFTSEGPGWTTTFPKTLASPLRVERDGAWFAMRLRDAAGTGTADGTVMTYAGALPGTDVAYRASDTHIGEDIVITSATAPDTYTFDLTASRGVTAARAPGGGIAFARAGGTRLLTLAAPYAYGHKTRGERRPVDVDFHQVSGGWRATLSVDRAWLRRTLAREGAVTIDPTIAIQGAARDCPLSSDFPDTSYCGSAMWVGYQGDHDHTSLIKWDVSSIPQDAIATWADFGLYQDWFDENQDADKRLSLHRMRRDWTSSATWNTYDGVHRWTTPGGDFETDPAAVALVPEGHIGWTEWFANELAQKWISKAVPNYGLAVRDYAPDHGIAAEKDFQQTTGNNAATAPELDITWVNRTGLLDAYTFESQDVTSKTNVSVNVANGNLVFTTKDMSIPGLGGLDLELDTYNNSLMDPEDIGGFGVRSTGSLGKDVRLHEEIGGSITLYRGDGVIEPFINPTTSGGTIHYETPFDLPGVTLTKDASTGVATLDLPKGLPAWPGKHLTATFRADGMLTTLADQSGHQMTSIYYDDSWTVAPAWGGITDTHGDYYDGYRSYAGDDVFGELYEPGGGPGKWLWEYDEDPAVLKKFTAKDGSVYTYTSDAAHRLTKVVAPGGATTIITYDGTSSRVASIVRPATPTATTGPTTTFAYSGPTAPCDASTGDIGKVIVTRPDASVTTYCHDARDRVTYDDKPVAPVSGSTRLGLEKFWDYDQVDTAAGSQLLVNSDTGNLLWHDVPIVNPGRGLSTFVNLDYNSLERAPTLGSAFGIDPLANVPLTIRPQYNVAGRGISIGVSGPTRLNEPLGGVGLADVRDGLLGTIPGLPTDLGNDITLTDADGTTHHFTRDAGDAKKWIAPPGIHLTLRRFATTGDALADPFWVMTRPDGVAYFFNKLGYLIRTEDRNGNRLTYTYEKSDLLTGASGTSASACTAGAMLGAVSGTPSAANGWGLQAQLKTTVSAVAAKLCTLRVTKVTDPGNRDLTITYKSRAGGDQTSLNNALTTALGGTSKTLEAVLTGAQGTLSGLGTIMAPAPVATITDHAGRQYTFDYTNGNLTSFVEVANAGSLAPAGDRARRWAFDYFPADDAVGSHRLKTVTEVRDADEGGNRSTGITYQTRAGTPPSGMTATLVPQTITDRRGKVTTYGFSAYGATTRELTITDARGKAWKRDVDAYGRPTKVLDPVGNATNLRWDNGTPRRNDLLKVAEGVTSSDAGAVTTMTYEPVSGRLLTQTDYPDGEASPDTGRTTELKYTVSSGQPSLRPASDPNDDFVADLVQVQQPRTLPGGAHVGYKLTVDTASGNVTAREDLDGHGTEKTTYCNGTDCPKGLVKSETDEVGDVTTYANHDASGLPQTVVDPKGNDIASGFPVPAGHPGSAHASEHRWLYRYDAVGNLLSSSDPRNADAQSNPTAATPAARYTTKFTYDAFDRAITQVTPKKSSSDAYVTQTWTYDRNGNQLTASNAGTGRNAVATFSPTDQPLTVTQTAWARSGSDPRGNTYSTRNEVTTFGYDDGDMLVSRTDPRGASSVPAGGGNPSLPYTTEWTRDDAGRVVAESRHAATSVHVRSFALDGRGNVIGEIDAKRNSDPDGNGSDSDARTPAAAAAAAANAIATNNMAPLRWSMAYDHADQLLQQTERPTTTDITSATARTDKYEYDADGNVVKHVLPRDTTDVPSGFTAGAGNVATSYTYDHRDQPLTTTDPYGAVTSVTRRDDGVVTSQTTPRGAAAGTKNGDGTYKYFTTAYTYDAAGDLLTRSVPYAPNQYNRSGTGTNDYAGWHVTYLRDAVGNPATISDARGHSFNNTFLDGGQLASTERPSWWGLDWSGGDTGADDPGRHFHDPAGSDSVPVGGPSLSERDTPLTGDDLGTPQENESADGKFGNVDPANDPEWLPRAGTTTFAYDDEGRLTNVTDANGSIGRIDYDPVGRVVGTTQALGANPGATLAAGDPTPCSTAGCDRVLARRYDYDLDGNVTKSATLGDNTWHSDFTYDSFDRLIDRTDPGVSDVPSNWSAIADSREETGYEYDANDNLKRRITPRGYVTGAAAADHDFIYQYDSLDRLSAELDQLDHRWGYAYDVDDDLVRELTPNGSPLTGTAQDAYKTLRSYDADGRLILAQGPIVDGARNITTYTYYPDGTPKTTLAPGAQASTGGSTNVARLTAYDYDGRGLRTRVTRGRASGAGFATSSTSPKTTLTEFDANGNVRREIDPSGVDTAGSGASQTFTAHHTDSLSADLTATGSTNAIHARVYDYAGVSGDAGVASRIYQPRQDTSDKVLAERIDHDALARPSVIWVVDDVNGSAPFSTHTSYTRQRGGWISESRDFSSATVQQNDSTYDYDQQGNQLSWRLDPKPAETDPTKKTIAKITRDYWPSGQMLRRTGYRNPGASNESKSTYTYFFDPEEELTAVHDVEHDNIIEMEHDRSGRTTSVVQRWHVEAGGGGTVSDWQRGRDSAFAYDNDGNVTLRRINGTLNRTTNEMSDPTGGYRAYARFTYDAEDKETIAALYEPTRVPGNPTIDDSTCTAGGSPPTNVRCVRTTYHPSGQRRTRRQQDNTLMTTLFDDVGQPTERRRQAGGTGSDIVTTYDYDIRGNRTGDLPGQGTYAFNARNQLTKWTRGTDYDSSGRTPAGPDHHNWTIDYDRNNDGSTAKTTERQADGTVAKTRTYDYTGQRLDDIKQVAGGSTSWEAYRANEFGTTIQVETGISGSTAPPVTTPSKLADCTSPLPSTTSNVTNYCFDEFDRLLRQRSPSATEEQRFFYDGFDRRDERQDHVGGTTASSGYSYIGATSTISRQTVTAGSASTNVAYDHDSDNMPLAVSLQAGTSTQLTRTYATDANGNPTGLESSTGAVAPSDRYVYDPYGDLDADANAGMSADATTNPLRFNGFDYDSAVKTYDMRARDYRPSTGRFMQSDRYESAGSDLSLVADPLTQNRYDFGGADPVNNVEFDGHIPGAGSGCNPRCGDNQGNNMTADTKKGSPTEGQSTNYNTPAASGSTKPKRLNNPAAAQVAKNKGTINRKERLRDARVRAKAEKVTLDVCHYGGSVCNRKQHQENFSKAYTALLLHQDLAKVDWTQPQSEWRGSEVGATRWLKGAQMALADSWHGLTHPGETFNNWKRTVEDPWGTVTDTVKQCKEMGSGACAGYVTTSVFVGRGATGVAAKAARRASPGPRPAFESGACSFSGETLVLMADGTRKPIDAVRVGDLVLATDPLTGEQSARRVTHLWVHTDRIVQLDVAGEILSTTANHPFWDATDAAWERADALDAGDDVVGADGHRLRVEGLRAGDGRREPAYNLTVAGLHTYHVGRAGVLVHNVCRLTSPQARDTLRWLGVDTRQVVGTVPKWNEPIYRLPDGRGITRDMDGHRGGVFKVARNPRDLKKGRREGTYALDENGSLTRVGK
jgi:RHS repeat-associated protein